MGEGCKNTRKLLKNGEAAPPRVEPIPMPHLSCQKVDDFYLLRDGAQGVFLAASQFPKNRETRAPLVEEILTVKDKLDPKYQYLASAPVADPAGNKAQIRFSRKTKEQYVLTEVDRKATGWKAFYRDGAWVVESSVKKRRSAGKKKTAKKTALKKTSTAVKRTGKRVSGRKRTTNLK